MIIYKSNEVLYGELSYGTLCQNENVICTQAELQAVAKFLLTYLQIQG